MIHDCSDGPRTVILNGLRRTTPEAYPLLILILNLSGFMEEASPGPDENFQKRSA